MRWLVPLCFVVVAALLHVFVPTSWGQRDLLVLIIALLGAMILLSDLIVKALSGVFSAYSHLWCFVIAPGTILHELGHYTACLLTRLEVTELRLFSPNPQTGQLGYVNFRFRRGQAHWSVIQGLIVAMAPFVSGALALVGLLFLIAPDMPFPDFRLENLDRLREIYTTLWAGINNDERLGPWRFLAIYGVLVIGSGAAPSTTDFLVPFKQGARRWLGALVALGFVAGLAALVLFVPVVSRPLVSVLALAAACQLISLLIILALRLIVGAVSLPFKKKRR